MSKEQSKLPEPQPSLRNLKVKMGLGNVSDYSELGPNEGPSRSLPTNSIKSTSVSSDSNTGPILRFIFQNLSMSSSQSRLPVRPTNKPLPAAPIANLLSSSAAPTLGRSLIDAAENMMPPIRALSPERRAFTDPTPSHALTNKPSYQNQLRRTEQSTRFGSEAAGPSNLTPKKHTRSRLPRPPIPESLPVTPHRQRLMRPSASTQNLRNDIPVSLPTAFSDALSSNNNDSPTISENAQEHVGAHRVPAIRSSAACDGGYEADIVHEADAPSTPCPVPMAGRYRPQRTAERSPYGFYSNQLSSFDGDSNWATSTQARNFMTGNGDADIPPYAHAGPSLTHQGRKYSLVSSPLLLTLMIHQPFNLARIDQQSTATMQTSQFTQTWNWNAITLS